MGVGLVSYGCYYKLPPISWLKRTQMCSLAVLEATRLSVHGAKVRVWAKMVSSGGSRAKSISLPFLASGGCLHSLAQDSFLQSLQPFASVITSPTSSFDLLGSLVQEPLWLHLGPIQIIQDNFPHLKILNPITSASPFCHTR